MPKLRNLGVVAAVIAYPFILTSIALSPWFNLYDDALSDLGNTATNGSVGYVFNAGMILAGILTFVFVALLVRAKAAPRVMVLLWAVPLMLASIDLALIGVFSENTGSIHGVVSVIFFVMAVVSMLTFSYTSWPLGSPSIGAVALVFGILSALIWLIRWPWTGVAIQESVTSGMTAIWLLLIAAKTR